MRHQDIARLSVDQQGQHPTGADTSATEQILPVEIGPPDDGERIEPVARGLLAMDDTLDHDLVFRTWNSQMQALIAALDGVAEHLRVEIDPAHHHEDDVDQDIIFECLIDPYRVRLLGGKAGDSQRFQDILGIPGRPARPREWRWSAWFRARQPAGGASRSRCSSSGVASGWRRSHVRLAGHPAAPPIWSR